MYHDWNRRSFLQLLTAAACTGKPAVRAGCQTRCYGEPPRTLATLLPLVADIADAGYQGFETNYIVLGSMPDPAAARPEIEKRLPLIGLHLGVQLHLAEREEKNRAEIARVAKGTRELGGDHIMLSGAVSGHLDGDALRSGIRRKSDELIRAARVCRDSNIRLCVHNHVEETRNDFYELREVLANTPAGDVWLLLDIGHAGVGGANAAAFFRSHAARIAGLHVRDRIGERQVPMGTGQVDLHGIAAAIRETGWSGWVIVELEGTSVPGVSSSENVRLARQYLKKDMNI
jgi:inosose dehydratase